MSRVTSKLQVTVPKAIARRCGIRPGDDLRFEESGEAIRVVPANTPTRTEGLDVDRCLRLFDAATARQRARIRAAGAPCRRAGLDQGAALRAWPFGL